MSRARDSRHPLPEASRRCPTHPISHRTEVPFAPAFVHRLHFTGDVLGADQEVLAEVLEPSGGPAGAGPVLGRRVRRRGPARTSAASSGRSPRRTPDRIERAGNVQVVVGGRGGQERYPRPRADAQGLPRRRTSIAGATWSSSAAGRCSMRSASRRRSRHRGLRLVRLPTTTLGQADSGVGVKNGVNLFGKKNWIGSFAVPWAVINDTALLGDPARPRLHLRLLRGGEGLAPEGPGDVRHPLPDRRSRSARRDPVGACR